MGAHLRHISVVQLEINWKAAQLTVSLGDKASSLELLNWNMRISREEDHVPVVIAHGRRAIVTVQIQKNNEQLAVVLKLIWVGWGKEACLQAETNVMAARTEECHGKVRMLGS